jgi:outer membrane protein OmpA-like peptidoglycan-associated protein
MPLPVLPRRSGALLGAALLVPPVERGRAAEVDDGPAPPAEAPPSPAQLDTEDAPAPPSSGPLETVAEGRWRIRFAAGHEALSDAAAQRLEELGRRLALAEAAGRITVESQSSGPIADVSTARRVSLGRALAVKDALAHGGLAPTRIDLRPLGRTGEAVDAVDILPPPIPLGAGPGGPPAGRPDGGK